MVDYRDFAPAPSAADTERPGTPRSQVANEFPLPFVPVIDPARPCRAYRLTTNGHSIQRTLDAGSTWQTVLDGAAMTSQPRFRRIYIGGHGTATPVVYVSEVANGDSLVKSTDGGTTWQLADGWDPANPNAVNLVGTFVFSVTPSEQDSRVVYVIEAVCQDARPHSAQVCSTNYANNFKYDTSDELDALTYGDIGGLRLYVTRDAGGSWQRLADPNADPTPGGAALCEHGGPCGTVPEGCDANYAWVTSDPRSQRDGAGILHDHIWIGFTTVGQCTGRNALIEGTWNGSTADATATYQFTIKTPSQHQGGAAMRAMRSYNGTTRLVLSSGGLVSYYSDNDSATWNPVVVNNDTPTAGLEGPNGTVFLLGSVIFGQSENGQVREPRAYLMTPTAGGYDVHLGATFPPGLSHFASYGGPWAASDTHERSLFNWPGYDPMVSPDWQQTSRALESAHLQRDDAGNDYAYVGTICWVPRCQWDGKVPDSLANTNPFDNGSPWARWQLMRYTPPASIDSLVTLVNPFSPQAAASKANQLPQSTATCAHQGRCSLVPIAQCTIGSDGQDLNGSLAFDGRNLLYSVTGDAAFEPYTALIHRLDPSACSGSGATSIAPSGTIIVRFSPNEYDLARSLTWMSWSSHGYVSQPTVSATQPLIDTMAYDASHDRLYFSLSSYKDPSENKGVRMENQLSLWAADLHTVAGVPAGTVDAHLVTVNTGYCPDFNNTRVGAGSETLAFDRVDGSLWACLPGRPAKLDSATGKQIDQPCYETPDLQGNNLTGFHAYSWTMQDLRPGVDSHRAFLLQEDMSGARNVPLIQFDLASCKELRKYLVPNPASGGLPLSERGSFTLACDPVTFGDGTATPDAASQTALASKFAPTGFTGTPLGAVMWARTGPRLTALLLPDNGDSAAQATQGSAVALQDTQTCRLPVSLTSLVPPAIAPGAAIPLCARLTIDGPGAPVRRQKVQVLLDGVDVTSTLLRGAATDESGEVCVDGQQLAAGTHRMTFSFQPAPADLAFYSAATSATFLVGLAAAAPVVVAAPAIQGPPVGAPPPNAQPLPAHVVPLTVPAVAEAPAPAAEPPGEPPVQPVAQAQGQTAAAEEREEQAEFAYAYEMPEGDQPEAEAQPPAEGPRSYPMSALGSHNGRPLLLGGALSGMTALGIAGLTVGLRWSCARRRRPEFAQTRQRRW